MRGRLLFALVFVLCTASAAFCGDLGMTPEGFCGELEGMLQFEDEGYTELSEIKRAKLDDGSLIFIVKAFEKVEVKGLVDEGSGYIYAAIITMFWSREQGVPQGRAMEIFHTLSVLSASLFDDDTKAEVKKMRLHLDKSINKLKQPAPFTDSEIFRNVEMRITYGLKNEKELAVNVIFLPR